MISIPLQNFLVVVFAAFGLGMYVSGFILISAKRKGRK